MSGNPFRRQASGQAEQEPVQQVIPKKKVKKVQFVSPVASPSEPISHPRFPSLEELDDGPKSPPPKGADHDNIDTAALLRGDLTAGGAIDLRTNEKLLDASAASTPISPTPPPFQLSNPPPGRRGPPANPFARTLATMEQPATNGQAESAAGKKAAMDVDAFKRLLLTGKADDSGRAQAKDTQTKATSAEQIAASRRSTTSGSERNSEILSSDDSSLEDASSESTVSEDEPTVEIPGASKIEGSKSEEVTTSIPQSAAQPADSFDDFDDDLQPSIEESSEQIVQVPENTSRDRSGSDLNKPLPAPPAPTEPPLSPLPSAITPTSAKRPPLPPPPPSARRRGHAPLTTRSRSSSNAESPAPTPVAETPEVQLSNKPKPPPPRAPAPRSVGKEAKRLSSQSIQTVEPPADATMAEPAATPIEARTPTLPEPSIQTKLKPPPPPSRSISKPLQQTLHRTPSSSSTVSQRKPSPSTAPSSAPPPPPRPRRGEAKTPSNDAGTPPRPSEGMDSRRSSGMSFGSNRRDSVSSLQRVAEETGVAREKEQSEAEGKGGVDMLADLDAFQREVDALRAKALKGG